MDWFLLDSIQYCLHPSLSYKEGEVMAVKTPRNYIEMTYDSMMTLVREDDVKQPNGSWKTEKVEVFKDVPCGVYVHRAEEFDTRRTVQPETGDFRVFVNPDIFIFKGDHILINSYGRTYRTICGDPAVYETHQEVICRQDTLASGDQLDGNTS